MRVPSERWCLSVDYAKFDFLCVGDRGYPGEITVYPGSGLTRGDDEGIDSHICFDGKDLLGRTPGELSVLLARGLLESGIYPAAVTIASEYRAALHAALDRPEPVDFLLVVNSGDDVL